MAGASTDKVTEAASWLRWQEELHVVEVAAHLLRICRDHRSELDAALQGENVATMLHERYRPAIAAALEAGDDPEYLDGAALETLAQHLERATDPGDLALRAHDAATLLDLERGLHFFSYFAGERIALAPGLPVPITPDDVPAEEIGTNAGLAPMPDRLEVPRPLEAPLDGTRRLRLCPMDVGRLDVVLDAMHHGAIDRLFARGSVHVPGPDVGWAAVVPSCAILEDLTYDAIDGMPPKFYRVRPREERAAAYRARIQRGLAQAVAAGARVIILPELSVDRSIEAMILEWFEATPTVALLVAGSRHLDEADQPRRNRCRVFMRGPSRTIELVHDKFSSFDVVLAGVKRVEDIQRPNTLTVFTGRRWSFAPLICKDLMEPIARRVLIDMRTRAVLVAAMSPKTKVFEQDAAEVAKGAQSLVFVCNAPHGAEDAIAILATPRLADPMVCTTQVATGLTAVAGTNSSSFQVISAA